MNGQCTDEINGYSCVCDDGWTGTFCEGGKCAAESSKSGFLFLVKQISFSDTRHHVTHDLLFIVWVFAAECLIQNVIVYEQYKIIC